MKEQEVPDDEEGDIADEEEPHTEQEVKPIEPSSQENLNNQPNQSNQPNNANVKSIESSLPGNTLEATIEKNTIEKKAD